MNEIKELIGLLKQRAKLAALLAPSFPIMYKYPGIVGKLKRVGFQYVMEVAAGADDTNKELLEALNKDKKARFIASPCPSIVRMVRQKYPRLIKYLAFAADSPMVASAKIVREKYPGFRPVFIGPCIAKKFEAKEDYPELDILVLTYKEMNQVFTDLKITDGPADENADFDIKEKQTRLYPISGGLAQSSGIDEILTNEQYMVVSGWQNDTKAIEEFERNPRIKLLDILFCEGGCIMGPGIESDLTVEQRRKKIVDYWK